MTTQQPLFYTHFPYCIRHLEGDRYIILNRNYKPLGQTSFEYVDYNKHPSVVHLKITEKQAEKLSYDGLIKSDYIYFYDDKEQILSNPTAFNNYMSKVKLLVKKTPKLVF